jgi:hypothetical protein
VVPSVYVGRLPLYGSDPDDFSALRNLLKSYWRLLSSPDLPSSFTYEVLAFTTVMSFSNQDRTCNTKTDMSTWMFKMQQKLATINSVFRSIYHVTEAGGCPGCAPNEVDDDSYAYTDYHDGNGNLCHNHNLKYTYCEHIGGYDMTVSDSMSNAWALDGNGAFFYYFAEGPEYYYDARTLWYDRNMDHVPDTTPSPGEIDSKNTALFNAYNVYDLVNQNYWTSMNDWHKRIAFLGSCNSARWQHQHRHVRNLQNQLDFNLAEALVAAVFSVAVANTNVWTYEDNNDIDSNANYEQDAAYNFANNLAGGIIRTGEALEYYTLPAGGNEASIGDSGSLGNVLYANIIGDPRLAIWN